MKKSKIFKIIALCFVLLLILLVLWFVDGFYGNPISKKISNRSIEDYIEKTYPNNQYEIADAKYNFKSNGYYSEVSLPGSIDIHFRVSTRRNGKISYDSYQSEVVYKQNVFRRINDEYRKRVDEVVEAQEFPYPGYIKFGEIMGDRTVDEFGNCYGITTKDLIIDKEYDVMELAKDAGHLVLYIEDQDVSIERASEILLDIKNILDDKYIKFYAIDFNLIKPRVDDRPNKDDTRINIDNFLYKDIYKEGLAERITVADKALNDYYKEQDEKERKEREKRNKE